MALTLTEKSDIRRHLRYPPAGLYRVSVSGGTLAGATSVGYRYLDVYGMMEWRMNNLDANEEARLTGRAYGSLAFQGPTPNVGDTLTVTFSGGGLSSAVSLTLTVTAAMLVSPNGLSPLYFNANNGLNFCSALAALVATNSTLTSAGFVAIAPFGTGPFTQTAIPIPQIEFTNPAPFTLSVSFTGLMSAVITSNGALLDPSIQPGTTNPIWGYLPILNYLENAYGSASQDLSIKQADVFFARPTELSERLSLYQIWAQRLGEFIDIPLNTRRRGNFKSSGPSVYM
jgi:hypothetical protein